MLGSPIIDLPFPQVPATWDETQVAALAEEQVRQISALHPASVLCQGEFTLVYQVVQGLKALGIPVLAACSERNTITEGNKKISIFQFVRFRSY